MTARIRTSTGGFHIDLPLARAMINIRRWVHDGKLSAQSISYRKGKQRVVTGEQRRGWDLPEWSSAERSTQLWTLLSSHGY